MKTLFNTFLLVAAISSVGFGQVQQAPTPTTPAAVAPPSKAEMTFVEETIDYGTIEQDADGQRFFEFKNTGTDPLVIERCQGTCGCTVPTCPTQPVLPGESAKIEVKYATNRLGQFNKGVKIYSNASVEPKTVYIKGNVLPKANQPAATPAAAPAPNNNH